MLCYAVLCHTIPYHTMPGFIFGEGKFTYTDGGFYEGEFRKVKLHKVSDVEFPDCDGKRNGMVIWVTFHSQD